MFNRNNTNFTRHVHEYIKKIKYTNKDYLKYIFDLANVKSVVMTNDTFDAEETKYWEKSNFSDNLFMACFSLYLKSSRLRQFTPVQKAECLAE